MSKHTPGPWDVFGAEDSSSGEWRELTVSQASMPFIRVCFMPSDGTETIMANARLIAAAPEMYEALCAALPLLEFEVETRGDSDSDYEFPVRSALDAVRAAIAKATGERL